MKRTVGAVAALLAITINGAFASTPPDPDVRPSSSSVFLTPATSTGTDPASVSRAAVTTPSANWSRIVGTVDSVESTSSQIRLRDDSGNSTQVVVGDSVVIRRAGTTIKYADVRPGDRLLLIHQTTATPPVNR